MIAEILLSRCGTVERRQQRQAWRSRRPVIGGAARVVSSFLVSTPGQLTDEQAQGGRHYVPQRIDLGATGAG